MFAILCIVLSWSPADPIAEWYISLLGSEDFYTRRAASAALERMETAAAPALRRHQHDEDPEVRKRVAAALDAYYSAPWQGRGPFPWIDMLPNDWEHPGVPPEILYKSASSSTSLIIDTHLRQARGGTDFWSYPGYYGGWPDYRDATVLLVRNLLDKGWSVQRVRNLLLRMEVIQRDYCVKCGIPQIEQIPAPANK